MDLTLTDWLSLLLATVLIALSLIAEHKLTAHLGWPERWYYAEGLAAVLLGLSGWLAIRQIQVDWLVAVALVVCGCAAGGPDWILLRREEQRRNQAWAILEAQNAELAAKLQILLAKRTNSNYIRRIREAVETAAFATAALKRERELIELQEERAAELLRQLQKMTTGQ